MKVILYTLTQQTKQRKKERVTVGSGVEWSGVDGKRRGENGSGGELEMRAASGHNEWLWVSDL